MCDDGADEGPFEAVGHKSSGVMMVLMSAPRGSRTQIFYLGNTFARFAQFPIAIQRNI